MLVLNDLLDSRLTRVYSPLPGRREISLDPCYNSDYNLDLSPITHSELRLAWYARVCKTSGHEITQSDQPVAMPPN